MKRVLFILFSCLLLVIMLMPACVKPPGGEGGLNIPPGAKTIKVGVIGPMQFIQGRQHWLGAQLAAEEINKAGGFKIGDETYYVDLIKTDSNETLSITDAAAAMEKLLTVDKADFVMGGFRTEGVFPMQEIAMDNKKIFIGCGAATLGLCTPVKLNYDRYKYWFRETPFPGGHLVDNMLMQIAMASDIIKEETGIQRPLRVAILAENAEWSGAMPGMMNAFIPRKLGMEVVGTWKPSPNATEVSAEMSDIQSKKADIINPILSGAVGIAYGRAVGELKVPVASVGINVEGQALGFWQATNGLGNYDTGLASYSKNMEQTSLTKPFFDAILARDKEVPTYTAGTYDAVYMLTEAITRAGTIDADAVVVELEKTDKPTTVSPRFTFTGMDSPEGNPHDVAWGPKGSTGIGAQWQDGELLGIWPNPDYMASSIAAGYDPEWGNVRYKGVAKWKVNPVLAEKLKAEAATEAPAAPPAGEQPAAPPAGEQPAAPPAGAAATSFEAAAYTNDKYGFTVQYPKEWVERPDMLTTKYHVAARSVSAFVPGIVVLAFPADAPESVDWIKTSVGLVKGSDPKVMSDIKETTTPDGSKAYIYKLGYIASSGYACEAIAKDVDRGDTRIRFMVYTVTEFEPFNEAKFTEIANTATFK